MDSMKLFWGLLILGLGGVFLCINQGIISSSIWGIIVLLWPVILLAIGLSLLIKNEKLASFAILLLVLGATTFIVIEYKNNADHNFRGNMVQVWKNKFEEGVDNICAE